MDSIQRNATAKAAATVIDINDINDIELPPAKFAPKLTPDGRSSTMHSIATLRGVGVRLGGEVDTFKYRPAADGAPDMMHKFVRGLMNVHVYDQMSMESLRDGKTPVDVEICAIVVRAHDGRIMDRYVYFNVRPATEASTDEPEQVLVPLHANDLPRFDATVYRSRKSGVAIRAAATRKPAA